MLVLLDSVSLSKKLLYDSNYTDFRFTVTDKFWQRSNAEKFWACVGIDQEAKIQGKLKMTDHALKMVPTNNLDTVIIFTRREGRVIGTY